MNKTRTILVTITLIVIFGIVAYHNQTKPRVLVIHSYNTDFTWVNDVNGGIKQYMAKAGGDASRVIVRYHYMDLRNHKTCDFYRSALNDAKLVIQDFKPQVIIIVDDIGQDLVGSQYLDFKPGFNFEKLYDSIAKRTADRDCPKRFATAAEAREFFNIGHISMNPNPTIIFAGVNGDVDNYGYYDANNVAGIFERKNFTAIYQTIEDIYRASPEDHKPVSIQILSDNSSTALAELPLFESLRDVTFTNVPLKWNPIQIAKTPDEWKQYVAEANQSQSMLLVANYGAMKSQQADIIGWTEKEAAYPMLGAATDFINDGGMLTFAVPGYEQGEVSITLAIKVLNGASISSLISSCRADKMLNGALLAEPRPFCSAKQFLVGMNQSLVDKRKLSLPLIYQSFSRQSGNYR